ncbi:RES family NAD+ phosphorylase [Rhizobium sp.]
MDIWRISRFADLTGKGGELASGRWHAQGHPIVYCADHPSTALLEMIVHLNPANIPESYQLLRIDCPDRLVPAQVDDEAVVRNIHDPVATSRFGTAWLERRSSCLLRVPSAIMPIATNYLFNPRHPDAATVRIADRLEIPFDRRLKSAD